ncbi:MAG: hypothetical protein IAI49_01565 [Candidatus Eremiobacteraeota bacterium]|nr:hypothetical protein [Candidatus Eremiobacteraeota bacterium]
MSDSKRPEADLDNPGELHTQADDERTLSRDEAAVAGILPGLIVYGDSSLEPNADDRRDLNAPKDDEHF